MGTQPYKTDWEYLNDELNRLVLSLCQMAKSGEAPSQDSLSKDRRALKTIKETIPLRLQATTRAGHVLALRLLGDSLNLGEIERQSVVAALAPHVDSKYSQIFASVQNNASDWPTVGLVLNSLVPDVLQRCAARHIFFPKSPLRRYRMIELVEPEGASLSLLQRSFKLDDRVTDFLLGMPDQPIDGRLHKFAELQTARQTQVTGDDLAQRIRTAVEINCHEAPGSNGRNLLFNLWGKPESGSNSLAHIAAYATGAPLLIADASRLLQADVPAGQAVWLLAREAFLQPAVLCLEKTDALLHDPAHASLVAELLAAVETFCHVTFVTSKQSWHPTRPLQQTRFIEVEVPLPDLRQRTSLWREQSLVPRTIDAGELAGKFRFTAEQIRVAAKSAYDRAAWRSPKKPRITREDLSAACRAESNQMLASLARKITPRYCLNDIVLPEAQHSQLEEICGQVKHRHTVFGDWGFGEKLSLGKGLSALFAGPPGTGKTMAAEILASELQMDLYRIDLSQVVSKYIGETEKNLQRIFDEAETSNAILLFDEADALFGKRSEVKDAHDRYANIEIAYLLQQMEEYEGVAILATNLRANLDPAFVRRLQFIIPFPFPDASSRTRIWRGMFSPSTPRGDINFAMLGSRYDVAGGEIRNIVVRAAYYAASNGGCVEMEHLLRATEAEFEKIGRVSTASDFEM